MALLLNIDTATDVASACLSINHEAIAYRESFVQKEHASFIHEAIKEMMHETGRSLKDMDAIAITAGPGSYTGLRVGMATAKGLCYALNKPLIAINTLEVMAATAIQLKRPSNTESLYCPMIDARRMEVFTALYDQSLENILKPCAMVLTPDSFDEWLNHRAIFLFGDGSTKFETIARHANAFFIDVKTSAKNLAGLAAQYFNNNAFANLAYSEPLYIKEFYFTR